MTGERDTARPWEVTGTILPENDPLADLPPEKRKEIESMIVPRQFNPPVEFKPQDFTRPKGES